MPPSVSSRSVLPWVFIALSLSLIGYRLGAMPLNARSEGRYAVVSMKMAGRGGGSGGTGGSGWLVPVFQGHPHLTKPPLIYWLEASCIRCLGLTELAVRLPSAVAGGLTFLLLLWFGRRIGGPALGQAAAGLLALMPLHVILGRLTLTDGLLGLFWFATLAFGYLAVTEPRSWRWPALLWLAVALGLLTKGPLAWVPVAILLLWLAVGGRWREARALRLPVGVVLSLLPLLIWVALVWRYHPEALDVWRHEMVARAVGHGDHDEPIWFFIPVFIAGLFPATFMMSLPGKNYPWTRVREIFRRGEAAALWTLAVVVPFVMFSLIRGKLMSYLLPLAPPLALLVGAAIVRRVAADPVRIGRRVSVAFVIGAFLWLTGLQIVIAVAAPRSDAGLLRQIQAQTGLTPPLRVVLLRNTNSALSYYNGRPVPSVDENELPAWIARYPADLVVIAKEDKWRLRTADKPELVRLLKQEMTWPGMFGATKRLVFRPADPRAAPTTAPIPVPDATRELDDNE